MKKDLAIDTTYDPPWFSLDYTFNSVSTESSPSDQYIGEMDLNIRNKVRK
jgi:hypothetical protein